MTVAADDILVLDDVGQEIYQPCVFCAIPTLRYYKQ